MLTEQQKTDLLAHHGAVYRQHLRWGVPHEPYIIITDYLAQQIELSPCPWCGDQIGIEDLGAPKFCGDCDFTGVLPEADAKQWRAA